MATLLTGSLAGKEINFPHTEFFDGEKQAKFHVPKSGVVKCSRKVADNLLLFYPYDFVEAQSGSGSSE